MQPWPKGWGIARDEKMVDATKNIIIFLDDAD